MEPPKGRIAMNPEVERLTSGLVARVSAGSVRRWRILPAEAALAERGPSVIRWRRVLAPGEWLSAGERERVAGMRHAESARLYAAGRAALRFAGGLWSGRSAGEVRILRGPAGKPQFADPGLPQFNKSHSHGELVIGVAPSDPVGIDLECRRRRVAVDRLAERFFHRSEWEALRACPEAGRKEAFLWLWVCKEAALKRTGEGLAGGLEDARVVEVGPDQARLERVQSGAEVRLALFSFGDYLGAITTCCDSPVANWLIAD